MSARLASPAGRIVVAMMARAPSAPGKSRLAVGLSRDQHAALRAALFDDTFAVVRLVRNVVHAVVFEPADAAVEIHSRNPRGVMAVAQANGGLGERLTAACQGFFGAGATGVVFVGSDLPDLPASRLRQAVAHLAAGPDRVVLGPATDGGYYLIGMRTLHVELFVDIDWGSERVLAQTLAQARRLGVEVIRLAAWADVDTHVDIARIVAARTRAARRTRAWARAVRNASARLGRRGMHPEGPGPGAAPVAPRCQDV